MMKYVTSPVLFIACVSAGCLVLIGAVFIIGDMLECEFPYFITLSRVRHAKTVSGAPASEIIARALSVNPAEIDYHRCSYCKTFEGAYPPGNIRIQVRDESTNIYGFAYAPRTGILRPADSATPGRFPEMGPSVAGTQGEQNAAR